MDQGIFLELGRQGMTVALLVSAPVFVVALVVGLLVSIFQAVTSINDQTLTFVPKILAIALALILLGPWLSALLVGWSADLFASLPNYIR
ncbi:MAG TPA: flagellar biosynthesis protein FliQ [bacterium]|nr:flagellar biosynthesis protein FliQ [bacterium]